MDRIANRIVFLILLVNCLYAGESSDILYLFEKGNEAYLNEDYKESVNRYESIIAKGYESGTLYYNLGNAYYKLGNIGHAILNYERSLKWLPNDENVTVNLKIANLGVKDRIDAPPEFFLFRWYRKFVNLFSSRGWAIWVTLSAIVAALSFTLSWNLDLKKFRFLVRFIMYASIVVFLVALPEMIQRCRIETNHDYGIILEYSVRSLAAPQGSSTELFIVHEGTKVNILDQDRDWYKIELIDGKQGWIPAGSVGLI
ncbi:MAG: hypothetical protein DRP89_03660 [Candidatus Neomarinimicrobiota bacterium]|nr:MAG: hypothetical protein DRP89_03660 [Candidatus Neomarinimicrobiota bacterium]